MLLYKNDGDVIKTGEMIAAKNPELVHATADALSKGAECLSKPMDCITLPDLAPVGLARQVPLGGEHRNSTSVATIEKPMSPPRPLSDIVKPLPYNSKNMTRGLPSFERAASPSLLPETAATTSSSSDSLEASARKEEDSIRKFAASVCKDTVAMKTLGQQSHPDKPWLEEKLRMYRKMPLPPGCNADGTIAETPTP